MVKIEWEEIVDDGRLSFAITWVQNGLTDCPCSIYRTALPGGWLVAFGYAQRGEVQLGGSALGGMTFVPDPNHEWQ